MSYGNQAALARDQDFLDRCTAAAAVEIHALEPSSPTPPQQWVYEHSWHLAGAPGFGDAYASGIANGLARPGLDDAVITDGMILGAVQALLADYPPTAPPTS